MLPQKEATSYHFKSVSLVYMSAHVWASVCLGNGSREVGAVYSMRGTVCSNICSPLVKGVRACQNER